MALTGTDTRTESQAQTRTSADRSGLTAPARPRPATRRPGTHRTEPTTRAASARLSETIEAREQLAARIERDRSENKTGLIYMVLLGGAACLALAGVVSTAQAGASTGVDAPPPAVFEQPATGN